MRWLSESYEQLVSHGSGDTVHEAVVVGSGYGGAVAALRLAEAGLKPLVLERGDEYLAGEFPNDAGELPAHVRLSRWGEERVTGYESGLFDFRLGGTVGALVGNALGGGSQINAGVAVEPDPRTFAKPAWPRNIRDMAGGTELREYFKRARDELQVEDFGAALAQADTVPDAPPRPAKNRSLKELSDILERKDSKQSKVRFEHATIAVNLLPRPAGDQGSRLADQWPSKPCVGCGDCVSGCNHSAKKTLTTTYLPAARAAGARLFTGVTVLGFEREVDGTWRVNCTRTSLRDWLREGVQQEPLVLRARKLILAAGTFGSTELLLRSQTDALKFSSRLGQQFSTNGDSIAVGHLMSDRVDGVGAGSRAVGRPEFFVGPTITAQIRVDDKDDVKKSVLIQEGAIPGAIAGIFHELVTTSATFAQLANASFRGEAGEVPGVADHLALDPRALTHDQTLLVMGHDEASGVLRLGGASGKSLYLDYPNVGEQEVFRRQEELLRGVEEQGAIYLANPALHPIPASTGDVLSGPKIGGGAFTVHPLGGCAMGDDAASGVVDHLGRVFEASGATAAVHHGLMVLDASIVPCALGVNPLLTITMLAERAMDGILGSVRTRGHTAALPAYPYGLLPERPYTNPQADRIALQLSEIMRDDPTTPSDRPWRAALVVHFTAADVKRLFADSTHELAIQAQAGASRPQVDSRLTLTSADGKRRVEYAVTGGTVRILPVPRPTRWQRFLARIRVLLTWFIARGFDETVRGLIQRLRRLRARLRGASPAERCPGLPQAKMSLRDQLRGLWRMAGHAAEERRIDYELDLEQRGTGARHTMVAKKHLAYAASWRALVTHFMRRLAALGARLVGRRIAYVPLERSNLWKSLGEVDYRVLDGDREFARGIIGLDLVDMGHRFMPQLLARGDTANAMVSAAGFLLMFARLLIKTRLWDFQLPDYPRELPREFQEEKSGFVCVPAADSDKEVEFKNVSFPPLRIIRDGRLVVVPAQPAEKLEVERFRSGREVNADPKERGQAQSRQRVATPVEGQEMIELMLTRYARPAGERPDTVVVDNATRIKTIILMNGFAQSTLPFVAQELERRLSGQDEPNLAEFFYQQGFDVWLFDYRTSSLLDASKSPCSMDDIAMLDVPAAVNHVLGKVSAELGLSDTDRPQLYFYAHCVGAASVAMALLSGSLRYLDGPSKVAGVALSQMQMLLVAGRSGQTRVLVPPFLRDVLRVDFLRLSAAERQPDAFEAVLDRFFATLDPEGGEYCPHEFSRIHEHPDMTTCKRMSGTLAPLLKHDRIRLATHERLPIYFGRANVNLLAHGGKCVEYERLVNEDGQNVYVTEANIRAHLDIPVALVHGRQNRLFHVESCERTFAEIGRVNPGFVDAKAYRKIIADNFAHFDTTIGYGAKPDNLMQEQILEKLKAFYEDAWTINKLQCAQPGKPKRRSRLRAPLAGPVIGWTRKGAMGRRLVRVWIEVDETETDPARYVITRVRGADGVARVQLWPVLRVPMAGLAEQESDRSDEPDVRNIDELIAAARSALAPADAVRRPWSGDAHIAIGLADLEFDLDDVAIAQGAVVEMASLHDIALRPAGVGRPDPQIAVPREPATAVMAEDVGMAGLPIAVPLGPEELCQDGMPGACQVEDGVPRGCLVQALAELPPLAVPMLRTTSFAEKADGQIKPLPISLDAHPRAVAQLFATLEFERALRDRIALEPDPATFSRSMRSIEMPGRDQCTISRRTLVGGEPDQPLRFMAGCCRHPGLGFEAYRADLSLSELASVAQGAAPDFCLMLGDQIYADATAALVDSSSPVEKIALRYRSAWASTGMRAVTASMPTYMTIDDHEIDDNWSSDRLEPPTPPTSPTPAELRDYAAALRDHAAALRLHQTACGAYAAYQWSHSPRNLMGLPGFNYDFECGGHDFFVLDTRSQRKRFGAGVPAVVSSSQLAALSRWLDRPSSGCPRFVVTGSVLFPGLAAYRTGAAKDLAADNWQLCATQREEVLAAVVRSEASNVVFISGDYHCDAVAELRWRGECRALALVVPPFYAPYPGANVKAWEVLAQESFTVAGGTPVDVIATMGEGSGFAGIEVRKNMEGFCELTTEFRRMDLNFKSSVAKPKFVSSTSKFTFKAGVIERVPGILASDAQ
ncbi:MAG: alkaline phosphatase D family protein [Burkholderiales bacterium]|nr:alkaline phosphatase D family protein [Burkholderiales bacterium]